MEELRSYYEHELTHLRQYAREFAARYPKIASRLSLMTGVDSSSADPHVERLFESFALMMARTAQKLDDDYPEFTEGLVETLYPHYLRPFPSCSIAHFDVDNSRAAQMSAPIVVPRGTQLYSRPVRGTKILFRTAYDVTLSPLQLTAARFHAMAEAPGTFSLPSGTSAQISLTFAIQSAHASVAGLKLDSIRLYTQGDPIFASALRDALSINALRAYVEPGHTRRWIELDELPFATAGMAPTDSLFPYPASAEPAYLLLTEFFAYPEKFGFFDCDLRQAGRLGGRQFTLHVLLKDIPADSPAAQVLATLSTGNVLAGCTPVVNLFETSGKLGNQASPSSTGEAYPLEVDEQNAYAYEVYSIDSVAQVKETSHGEQIKQFDAFYSLHHSRHPTPEALYWRAHRDHLLAKTNPGQEIALGFVNGHLKSTSPPVALDLKFTCSNRDLPEQLARGLPGGDLMMEGGTLARRISLLHQPTKPLRFSHDRGALWRLISQLSLNAVSLAGGVEPIRDLLAFHDLKGSPISARQVDSVVDLTEKVVTAWIPDQPFAGIVRGIEIHLTIDEEGFAGTGIHVFAQLIDRLLSLYVATSNFTQLVLLSSRSGNELLRCPRRTGAAFLI